MEKRKIHNQGMKNKKESCEENKKKLSHTFRLKGERMNIKKAMLLIVSVGLVTACGKTEPNSESNTALIKTINPPPININHKQENSIEKKVKKDIAAFPEIYDVAVLKGKEEMLIAYKVKHLQRFKMKKIEKNINRMIEDKYPDEDFIVSSDYKIFLEAIRLQEDMKNPNFSKKKAEKRLSDLIELKKELT